MVLISTRQLADKINTAKTRLEELKVEQIELKKQIKEATDEIEKQKTKKNLFKVLIEIDKQNSIIKSQRYNLKMDGEIVHKNLRVLYVNTEGIMFEYVKKRNELSSLYIQIHDNPLLEENEDGDLTDTELEGGKSRRRRRKVQKKNKTCRMKGCLQKKFSAPSNKGPK
jgi:hypothetical protein